MITHSIFGQYGTIFDWMFWTASSMLAIWWVTAFLFRAAAAWVLKIHVPLGRSVEVALGCVVLYSTLTIAMGLALTLLLGIGGLTVPDWVPLGHVGSLAVAIPIWCIPPILAFPVLAALVGCSFERPEGAAPLGYAKGARLTLSVYGLASVLVAFWCLVIFPMFFAQFW